MRNIIRDTLILALLVLSSSLHAQYTDHRGRKTDSLEVLLETGKPQGKELYRIYDGLMNGYLQTDGEKSSFYAKRNIEICQKENFLDGLCDSWRILGLNAYGQCLYDSARHCFNEAQEATARMEKDKRYTVNEIDDRYSSLYGTLGNLYNIQGMLHLALDYYQKALPVFQKHGWKESESILHYNVGELYLELGNFEAAETNYKKSLEVALSTGDSLIISAPYSGLAMTSLSQGKTREALEYAGKAIVYPLSHPKEEAEDLLDDYVLLSRIHLEGFMDPAKAQEYMDKALLILEEDVDVPTNISDAYLQQASICLSLKEWARATEWAHKALKMNDQDPQHNIGVYKVLAESYAALGKSHEAQEYIQKMHDTMQEQSTTKYQSALSEMEIRYQTLEKEAKIRDLEARNRVARLQNGLYVGLIIILIICTAVIVYMNKQKRRISNMISRMQGEADERTRLGRDLHDRLGGLLTSIHMQSSEENIQDLSRQATEEMRRVAHHLMPAALKESGLATALRDFCRVNPMVSFSHHGQDLRLPEQQEVMLYCATHELVNNALKHAQATRIMVQLMIDEEYAAVIVADNGKGFKNEKDKDSMGLRNIRERAELQMGRMNISTSSSGTEINIEIPR